MILHFQTGNSSHIISPSPSSPAFIPLYRDGPSTSERRIIFWERVKKLTLLTFKKWPNNHAPIPLIERRLTPPPDFYPETGNLNTGGSTLHALSFAVEWSAGAALMREELVIFRNDSAIFKLSDRIAAAGWTLLSPAGGKRSENTKLKHTRDKIQNVWHEMWRSWRNWDVDYFVWHFSHD